MLKSFGKLLPYVYPQSVRLAAILVLSLVLSASAALQPWPLKIVADYAIGDIPLPSRFADVVGGQPSPQSLVLFAALASIGIVAVRISLDSGIRWLWASAGQRMVYSVAAAIYGRLLRLSRQYHAHHSIGDSLTRISTDAYCIYFAVQGSGVTPIQALFTLATVGVIAWQLDPYLTLLSFVLAPVIAATTLYSGKRIREQSREQIEASSKIAGFVHQSLEAMPLIQSYGAESRNKSTFESLSERAVVRAQRASFHKNLLGFGAGITAGGGLALVLFAGGQRVITGAITIGALLVFIEYLRLLQGAMRQLMDVYGLVKQAEANVDRVLEVLESEQTVPENRGAPEILVRPDSDAVQFDDVSFFYGDSPTLENVSFSVQAGETIAVVGQTGAGKSTLISLIPRFADVQQGSVNVFGQDVRTVRLSSLREQMGVVFQDPYVFTGSIAENIAIARPGATRAEIERASVDARLHEYVEGLEDGYETVIGEHGATLSGGQRQRVAVARALLRDAQILIMDEPTSALDVQTESSLLDALDRLMQGRTTFIITHRFSTLRDADRILVLDGGRLRALGTHDELISSDALYRKLHELQTGPMEGLTT